LRSGAAPGSGPGNTGPDLSAHIGIKLGIKFFSQRIKCVLVSTFIFHIKCATEVIGNSESMTVARFDIYSLNRRLLSLPRATGVRPTACHPLRSWPAIARAATVSATLRPGLAGRAADRCYLYLLSTLALLAPLFVPPCCTVSRVRSSLAPLYCILTGTYRERQFLSVNRPLDPSVPTSV